MSNFRDTKIKYPNAIADIEGAMERLDRKDKYPEIKGGKPVVTNYDSLGYEIASNLRNLPRHLKTNQQTEAVQKLLQKTNYYEGEIDGFYGPLTKKAIANYTNDHVNEHIWNKMKGASKIARDIDDIMQFDTLDKIKNIIK